MLAKTALIDHWLQVEGKKSVLFLNLEGNSYFTKEQPNRHSKDLDKIFTIVCQTFYNFGLYITGVEFKIVDGCFFYLLVTIFLHNLFLSQEGNAQGPFLG